jgi:hypothetical protein
MEVLCFSHRAFEPISISKKIDEYASRTVCCYIVIHRNFELSIEALVRQVLLVIPTEGGRVIAKTVEGMLATQALAAPLYDDQVYGGEKTFGCMGDDILKSVAVDYCKQSWIEGREGGRRSSRGVDRRTAEGERAAFRAVLFCFPHSVAS